ncbi:triosephosphate isomerase [Salmonella enterica]|nr:triosephosphate isomerase [Salmonella enterica]
MSVNVIVGISHKTYFGYQQTLEWCQNVADNLRCNQKTYENIELFTFPAMLAIADGMAIFRDSGMAVGAQNVCAEPAGAWTGETSASMLKEIGCRYVEIGHAERRRHFGETTEKINRKLNMAFDCGLIPVICIGEESEMVMEEAAAFAKDQVNELLAHRKEPLPPLIFAWEPQWAIGAPEPASDEYIRYVCSSVRSWLQKRFGKQCRVIYGGSAGPGLLGRLWPDVDGIFLGRFAHQPSALEAIIEEAREIVRQ